MLDKNKSFYEIFEEIDGIKGKNKRIEKLHEYSSPHLKTFLDYTFNPKIIWKLPEGKPPYKEDEQNNKFGNMSTIRSLKKLIYFVNLDAKYENMQRAKRENLFINFLQSINTKDAELICLIKDKKFPFKHITQDLVKETFPLLAKNW